MCVALSGLQALLEDWRCDKSGPWRLLPLTGWCDFSDERVKMEARSQVLGALAGAIFHFDRRLSSFPWSWHILVDTTKTDAERQAWCTWLLGAPECCVPIVVQDFRQRFSDVESMCSPLAAAVVRSWEALQVWSTKASEMGHASERRQLNAAAAPGKAFLHHSRAHLIERAKTAHLQAGGIDPRARPKLRGAGRRPEVSPTLAPDKFGEVLPPELASLGGGPASAIEDDLRQVAGVPLDMAGRARAAIGMPPPAPLAGAPPLHVVAAPSAEHVAQLPPPPFARPGASKSGAGLSPYLIFLNMRRHEYKMQLQGRAMTPGEARQVEFDARQAFNSLSAQERSALEALHRQGVRRRKAGGDDHRGGAGHGAVQEYRDVLGIGVPACPVKPSMFCEAPLVPRSGGMLWVKLWPSAPTPGVFAPFKFVILRVEKRG